jgi:hypothetical protein
LDLLGILKAADHAREIAHIVGGDPPPDWATSEEAFLRHFGVIVEEYRDVVSCLSPEQAQLLERTLAVNPEAAVIWILSMEELRG